MRGVYNRKGSHEWSEEALTMITDMWKRGYTGTQIANRLARELKVYKTRNAVVGKLHRIGQADNRPANIQTDMSAQSGTWTAGLTKRLVEEYEKNQNINQIATTLNEAFGLRLTYRMVYKRLVTLDLHKPASKIMRPSSPAVQVRNMRERALLMERMSEPHFGPSIAFMEREWDQCCWPVSGNGSDMRVCGNIVFNRSYCRTHYLDSTRMSCVAA